MTIRPPGRGQFGIISVLNVVVNANAKTPFLAFCKPCEKRLLIVARTVNSLFVGKPGSDTFALFFEISVF